MNNASETIHAIREAAADQRSIPEVRAELNCDPALVRTAPGSDVYRWRQSGRHTLLEKAAERQGIPVDALVDKLVISGLESLRRYGDSSIRPCDIALSRGLSTDEVVESLERLEARGEAHLAHFPKTGTTGWILGAPNLTVTIGELIEGVPA